MEETSTQNLSREEVVNALQPYLVRINQLTYEINAEISGPFVSEHIVKALTIELKKTVEGFDDLMYGNTKSRKGK